MTAPFLYYIIPAAVMTHHVSGAHAVWLAAPGAHGQSHKDSKVRTVHLPPYRAPDGWDISEYLKRRELIEEKMTSDA